MLVKLQKSEGRNNPRKVSNVGKGNASLNDENYFCELVLTIFSYILVVITIPVSLFLCLKVVKEYERAVIFRLGRLLDGSAKGPGVIFILPCIDSYRKVDLRTVSYEAPPRQMLSNDAVPMSVNSVVFYRVSNPVAAVCNVSDFSHSTQLMATAAIQKEIGKQKLEEFLKKDSNQQNMEVILHEATNEFGVDIARI